MNRNPRYAYKENNSISYDEFEQVYTYIYNYLSQYGMADRFEVNYPGDGKWYIVDINTGTRYSNVADAVKGATSSRQRNIDPNATPKKVVKGKKDPNGKDDRGYANAAERKGTQERDTKIKQANDYNRSRGATIMTVGQYYNGADVPIFCGGKEFTDFERAKQFADDNIIVKNGKPYFKNIRHSDEIKMGTELEHYGRLGMKWGMHIYGEDEVKKKVDRKINKNTNRAARMTERSKTYSLRGDNKTAKSNWAWTGIGATVKSRQAKRSYRISYNSQKKAVRATKRAKKLASNFLQLKGNTRINMFSDTFEKNKHAQEVESYINDVLSNNFDYKDKED